MFNLPGFDLAQHVISTFSTSFLAQADVWNQAWTSIAEGKYGTAEWLKSVSRLYELNVNAAREALSRGMGSVPWVKVAVRPGLTDTNARISVPVNLRETDVSVTPAVGLGGAVRGKVTVVPQSVKDGVLQLSVEASADANPDDQWLALACAAAGPGTPFGAILVVVARNDAKP